MAVAVAVSVVVRELLPPDGEEDPDPDPDECEVVVVAEEALPEMGGTPRRRDARRALDDHEVSKARYGCSKEGSMAETHRRLWRSRCP